MIEVNPYYARESTVGPVFDVATWSRAKAYYGGVLGLAFGVLIAAALIVAWQPTLVLEKPPEYIADFHKETVKLQKKHPWAAYAGSGAAALVGWFVLAGSCASLIQANTGDYYFRAGPGGISVRVPHGLDLGKFGLAFKTLEFDLPMGEIAEWRIVQHKKLGSMSRNTGNTMAFLKIKTVDGKRKEFNLDCFCEPSHVIQSKIDDALQMTPFQFDAPRQEAVSQDASFGRSKTGPSKTLEEKCDTIVNGLAELLEQPGQSSSVVFSNAENGKFVQFASTNQSLLFDLPRQTLDETEYARASDYFARLRQHLRDDGEAESRDGAPTIGESGFQMNVADVKDAARLTLEIFGEVYRMPDDFPLVVEQL